MEHTDPQPAETTSELRASRRQVLRGGAALAAVAGSGLLSAAAAAPAAASTGRAPDGRGPKNAKVVVLRNVRPFGGEARDLICVDGVLADAVPKGQPVHEIDGRGRLALPTLVDAHIHPDKTGWGEKWQSRKPAADRMEKAAQDVDFAKALSRPTGERALGLLRHAVAQGTRGVRAHADVAPAYGVTGVEGLRYAQEKLRGILDVQVVGFPQHGVMRTPGTVELLERAAAEGLLDYVGGIDPTSFDGADAAAQQLDHLFRIATTHGVGIDIHLHEGGALGITTLRDILARTKAAGLTDGQVTVSHAYAIASLPVAEQERIADEIAAVNVRLTTVSPSPNSVLPHRRLRARGVAVGLGSDGVRDNWSPFGNADMLHRAWILGWSTGARLDEELDACFDLANSGGAEVMGLTPSTLQVGAPADLMIIDGENVPQIVVDQPKRDYVLRGGVIVAKDGEIV